MRRAATGWSGRPRRLAGPVLRGKSGKGQDFTLSACRLMLRQVPGSRRLRWIVRPENGRNGRQPLVPAEFFACGAAGRIPCRLKPHSTEKSPVNPFNRNAALWIVIVLLLALLYSVFQGGATRTAGNTVSYSDFVRAVEQRQVQDVRIQGNTITGTFREPRNGVQKFSTYVPSTPPDDALMPMLIKNVDRVDAGPAEEGVNLGSIFVSWLPVLVLVGVYIFFLRQMQSGTGRAMGFGKSKARLLTEKHGRVTFDDVAGIDEAKAELEEIVDFLKDPQKFQRLGGKIPKGCLLVGPPGTGKTLLARAIAGEANVPFFTISGSDFVEMFVGVGASRVRDMFEQAKKNAPCIVFIDEIDAVGRHRGAGLGGGNDEREQTLNQLLVEMDGFEANEGVILIAATNRPDVLDPALLRPGRFDRQVVVPNPDVGGREKILKVHMRKVPLAPDVDPRVLARGTPGFSGADLANLVNEAALRAARVGKRLVTMADFEYAKDKVLMGTERRSMVMTDEEKTLTAYHEAGHALVAMHVPKSDPLHKVTIIPRGRALGVTMQLPERDHLSHTKQFLESRLAILFGGRIAEEMIFGPENVTTGAASDIQMATQTARGHDHRVRHVREARPRALPGERAGSVPRPLRDPDAERLRGDRADHRPGGPPPHRGGRGQGARDPDRAPRRAAHDRQGAARVRDARATTRSARSCAARRSCATTPAGPAQPSAVAAPRSRPAAAAGPRRAPIPSRSRAFDGELTPAFALDRPRVMAIVNVTPDSFSDGGERLDPAQAIDDGLRFVSEGADIVDVGGESTRPGARPTSPDEELQRVLPVVEGAGAAEAWSCRSTRGGPRWRGPASTPARASSTTSRRCATIRRLLPLVGRAPARRSS